MTFRIGIVGASGYGGGELLRLALRHPDVEVAYVTSNSQEGGLGETRQWFPPELRGGDRNG